MRFVFECRQVYERINSIPVLNRVPRDHQEPLRCLAYDCHIGLDSALTCAF